MVVGVSLETACTGVVFPAVALLTQGELPARLPLLAPLMEAAGHPRQATLILLVMLGLVALYLMKNLFLAFLAWRQTRFAFGVQTELSQRLFAAYLRQPYTFHLQRNSAQLIRNATGEVALFTDVIVLALSLATEILVLAAIATLLLLLEPLGTLIAALLLGGAAWGFYRTTRLRIARWGEQRQHHDGLRFQHLQQGLGGAKDVKLLGREDEFLEQYRLHNTLSARVGQYQAAVQMLPRLWLELLAVVGLATLAITMLAQGREAATIVPTLALFAVAAFRLLPAVDRVLYAAQGLRFRAPVVDTLHQELALPDAAPTPRRGTPTPFRSE